MPIIETRHLTKVFRAGRADEVRAVDDVTLTIDAGQFVVLTGPSGSGKTTLLSLLGALDHATSGQIMIDGRSLTDCSDKELARVRRELGFVFQDFALLARLSLIDNVGYPLIPRGVPKSERDDRARRLLTRLKMEHRMTKRPEDLSGGERQRVAIARALIGEPRLVLADEPTSNLDPETACDVIVLFQELHAAGTTLVVASHDAAVATCATLVIRSLESGVWSL